MFHLGVQWFVFESDCLCGLGSYEIKFCLGQCFCLF